MAQTTRNTLQKGCYDLTAGQISKALFVMQKRVNGRVRIHRRQNTEDALGSSVLYQMVVYQGDIWSWFLHVAILAHNCVRIVSIVSNVSAELTLLTLLTPLTMQYRATTTYTFSQLLRPL